ncbi:unnamed protein product [Clavelina lepadiformis]|uniref:Uncharacterized protein n=1 Tax=Clavelina lepadiformis TaxID=159417 RepID=A0ABP0GG99_CLALP
MNMAETETKVNTSESGASKETLNGASEFKWEEVGDKIQDDYERKIWNHFYQEFQQCFEVPRVVGASQFVNRLLCLIMAVVDRDLLCRHRFINVGFSKFSSSNTGFVVV